MFRGIARIFTNGVLTRFLSQSYAICHATPHPHGLWINSALAPYVSTVQVNERGCREDEVAEKKRLRA